MSVAYQAIYPRVKNTISKAKGGTPPPEEIFARHELAKQPLRFTTAGQRGLAPRLNTEFAPEGLQMTRDQAGAAKTVRQLARKVKELLNQEIS